jgi:hypothetical protein
VKKLQMWWKEPFIQESVGKFGGTLEFKKNGEEGK